MAKPQDLLQKELLLTMMLERYRPVSLDEFEKVMAEVLDEAIVRIMRSKDTISMTESRLILAEITRQLKRIYGDFPDWIRMDEEYATELAYQTNKSALESQPSVIAAGVTAVSFNKINKKQIDALLKQNRQLGSTGFTLEDMVNDLSAYQVKRTRQILAKGVTAKQSPGEITRALQTLWGDVTRHRADAVVRTSIQDAADAGRELIDDQFQDVILGWQSVATLDNRTTPICIHYHLKKWLKKDGWTYAKIPDKPRRHPRCRSILIRLTRDTGELMQDNDRAAVVWDKNKKIKYKDGGESFKREEIKRLPADATYKDFFNSLTLKQQQSIVGDRKAKLMREGKISLSEIIKKQRDGTFKFMTNKQIEEVLDGS